MEGRGGGMNLPGDSIVTISLKPTLRPPPTSSHIISHQHTYTRTNPFLQGIRGGDPSCTTHIMSAAVGAFDVSSVSYTKS